MNRGIVEIARLGLAMGADLHTFTGLPELRLDSYMYQQAFKN